MPARLAGRPAVPGGVRRPRQEARSPGTAPTSSTSPPWSAASSARAAAARPPTRAGCSSCSASSAREPAARSTPTCASATTREAPTTATTMFRYGGRAGHPPRAQRCRAAGPERPDRARYRRGRRVVDPGRPALHAGCRGRHRRQEPRPAVRQPGPVLGRPGAEQRAARRRRPQRYRSPADRVRTADRLLRAAAADRAGARGPGRPCARRVLRRHAARRPARPGLDYAWSATSASNDNVDTVVERLCSTDGSPVTVRSTAYLVDGRCVPMDRQRARGDRAAESRRHRAAAAAPARGAAHPARHRPAAYHGARPSGRDRDPAQHLPARGGLGGRLRAAERPGADA